MCGSAQLHASVDTRKGTYHIARREVCGQSWEVCLEDLRACRHESIPPCSEVVPGFQAVLIREADGHVASIDNVQCSLV